jgi:MarR family transcriptional regulator, 2-MHQ and catechol-resistance regulon repressor
MKAYRSLRDFAEASIVDTGMCFTDFQILEILLHKGPLPVNTLAVRIGLTSGSATTAIDRLEKRQCVERRVADEDRRTRVVHLTPQGRNLIETAFFRHAADMETAAAVLSGEERESLVDLLRRLGRNAQVRGAQGRHAQGGRDRNRQIRKELQNATETLQNQ